MNIEDFNKLQIKKVSMHLNEISEKYKKLGSGERLNGFSFSPKWSSYMEFSLLHLATIQLVVA